MSSRKGLIVAAATAALFVGGVPAHAQTASNDFSYSPEAQERGKPITITGRCVDSEELFVSVQEGAAGDGGFVFSKPFPSETGAKINGSITVPDDAPFGPYVITGTCRTGPTSDFSKNGTFAVVEKAGVTTTTSNVTTTTTSSSTTSTTVEASGPTTTAYEPTELGSDVEATTDTDESTTTTVDEFAATRNDDDDSIGPLLLAVGAVPLVLAIGAIALAMRRNRNATTPPSAG